MPEEKKLTPRERLEALRRINELRSRTGGQSSEQPVEDFFGSGIIEPARAIGSAAAREVVGGYMGLGAAAVPGGKTGAEFLVVWQPGGCDQGVWCLPARRADWTGALEDCRGSAG